MKNNIAPEVLDKGSLLVLCTHDATVESTIFEVGLSWDKDDEKGGIPS